jgi:hypothetical protein
MMSIHWKHPQPKPSTAVTVPNYLADLVKLDRCSPYEARGLIYRAFFRAASRGLPAPSNEVLAAICCYESYPVHQVNQLIARGMIEVQRHTRSRRVRIVSTGKWTAPCSDDRPHWRETRCLDSLPSQQELRAG